MELKDLEHDTPIEGTTLFDGEMAMKGYGLNKMSFSFNEANARAEYVLDPEAYMDKFKLSEAQKQACRDKDVLALIREGGNIYYLAKFAGIFRLSVQDIGAQQTGMSVEEFKQKLLDQAK
ncbi:Protocatechuate 4,5-dioxygenase alpha chain [Aquimixticola soesokkakensis]|uniref:Protocatechuate 4,5-dioxygenase alpha chain n=1 Tax=Aquimixticola soesokkakensis TaxID=1519096 RepID=A0A1Y5SPL4_9RHOB|nr:protocatechuate 4,5-dioxygenase subunit alpha [Aquimixticola soesokkakensis]SLN45101.1 Protocatechuate 4,5-dioxygenase alpha chain [Aquimixticola soesokkakensis]